MDSDTILPLLDRYLAGECSAAEATTVRNWLSVNPKEHKLLVADIQQIRDVTKRRPSVRSVDAAWSHVVQQIELDRSSAAQESEARELHFTGDRRSLVVQGSVVKSIRGLAWYALAASAIVVFGVAIKWSGKAPLFINRTQLPVSSYTTTNGQRATITLVDGTTVELDVASRLDVPADFASGNHNLSLAGQALVTVSHHDGTPFTVTAGSTTTRVLGTSFLVRHYPSDTTTTVAVRDGKVMVGSVIVTAQRLVELGRGRLIRNESADRSVFSFATGMLDIIDKPLHNAIPELDRWFDADIRLGDPSLEKLRIEGKFATGSLTDVTRLLEMAFDVRVVRNGRVLTLYPRH